MTPLQKFYRNFSQTVILLVIVSFVFWTSRAVDALRVPHAKAAERLALVAELAHNRLITLPNPKKLTKRAAPDPRVIMVNAGTFALGKPMKGYWQLPGGNAHQNTVLKLYQDALRSRGVTDAEALHYGAAVLVSENEPLTLDRLGDYGHAFGVCQKNVKPMYAEDFVRKYPEWKTVAKQVDFCAQRFADAWARFKKLTSLHRVVTPDKTTLLVPENVFRTAVEHNCPACAKVGADSTRANHKPLIPSYFNRVNIAAGKLSLL